MRKARAFRPDTDNRCSAGANEDFSQGTSSGYVGIVDAASRAEETRREYDYRCLNHACGCKFHWRKAVTGARASRDAFPPAYKRINRPATFVKNPGSDHIQECPYDYRVLADRNSGIIHINDTAFMLINFDPGTRYSSDIGLDVPALSAVQQKAARKRAIKGFANMNEVVSFLKSHFKSFEDPGIHDISLMTQDYRILPLSKYLVTESAPLSFIQFSSLNQERFGFWKVKPDFDLPPRGSGRDLICCESFNLVSGIGPDRITPVLACADRSGRSQSIIRECIEQQRPVMVAGWARQSRSDTKGRKEILIRFSSTEQIATLSSREWSPCKNAQTALDFPSSQLN